MLKNKLLVKATVCLSAISIFALAIVFVARGPEGEEENELYDGPQMAAEFEFERTKDPATGKVPRERLMAAIDKTEESKKEVARRAEEFSLNSPAAPAQLNWVERGPNSDLPGPSNGNTRANSGIASGRMRSILVDAADATGKTVWVGGIDGGLWKTTDITASPATWTLVNDFLSNLAISDIAQQPGNPSTMYFSTGEGYFNVDAVSGNGVFKSTNSGVTWTQLSATANMSINRVIVDAAGTLYIAGAASPALGNVASGVQRSTNGGTSFTTITPTGSSTRIADMELSSTGRLHITTGLGNSAIGVYRFTDSPLTVAAGTWTAATTPFPYPSGNNCRVELGVSGNTLYALPSDTSAQVPTLYKSTDGGATWAATVAQPTAGWASGQAWYALSVGINPADPNQVIVGGLDTWKTTTGGTSWTKLSEWVGLAGQYVHADQHEVVWYDGGNKLLFGSDGGIFYSADGGTTIRDRNVGLRIKQFYSVAIHPTTTNYFLAGAQDNGSHQFNNAGLSNSVEVKGGDGAFVAIDQNEPQFQFVSYVFNQYRRSTNSGANWSNVDLNTGTGQFINPFDYDNAANIAYCGDASATYRRWTDPQTGSASAVINISNMSGSVTAVTVSPFTANRVYFGTNAGKVVRVDSANTVASGSAGVDLSSGLPGGTVTSINFGTDENNMIACESNFGINNVWQSTNAGSSWTAIDGNLPDMPVRWVMFKPNDNTRAYIATETGVWETNAIAGGGTVWVANTTFPTVRTDMLKYRPSDRTIAAATHGRGLWTSKVSSPLSAVADFNADGKTDLGVVRSAAGLLTWYINNLVTGTGADYQFLQFGNSTDTPQAADYDGDGKADVAVWRPGAADVAAFYIFQSTTNTMRTEVFGITGDDPRVVGDYDGDGKADVAVYRAGAQSFFYYRGSLNNPGNGITYVPWGTTGDVPTSGDYDGDGKADFVIRRGGGAQGQFWRRMSTAGIDLQFFGIPTDTIVPGDFDGDGMSDIAVVRSEGGHLNWYYKPSSAPATPYVSLSGWGIPGDILAQGDYDGDGKTDQAIFRPNADPLQNYIWVNRSTSGVFSFEWGAQGDQPITSFNTH